MKLIDINKKLSDDYKDTIIFMKFGNFYRCFYNNALVINYIFDYKLNDNRVGFPINIIDEVIDRLNNLNIDYLIYNNEYDVTYKYFENNNYNEYLEKGIIKEYSKRLTNELGKGYTETNLKYFRQFYAFLKSHTLCDELSWSHYRTLLSLSKSIGIILTRKENKFVMEYCSDERIIAKEYILL